MDRNQANAKITENTSERKIEITLKKKHSVNLRILTQNDQHQEKKLVKLLNFKEKKFESMRRVDSLEKTLMLGGIGGRRLG